MLPKPLRFLWGDLSGEELKKFGFLAVIFFFIIGSYWLLRPLKDGIFASLVGLEYQPLAKILSVFVMIPLVFLYSKLVDLVEKHKLFYVICSFYGAGFLFVAYLLTHPTIGLANEVASSSRLLGWVSYVMIESMGSIIVALFWSFVASSTNPASAKRGFALIISGAQLGSILGPTIDRYAENLGLPLLTVIAAVGVFIVPILIMFFMTTSSAVSTAVPEKEKPKTGMLEGLKLLVTRPYLLGVFAIATFYEVIGTIMDYQMKVLAKQAYPSKEAFTAFLGLFGQSANVLALVMALLGTSYLMRRFGLTFCLLTFPIAVGLVVSYVYINPMLWTVFASMIIVKGLSYALNNPSKEMMYIPTSKDVKFKSKSWIDMFGARSAKATGSAVNNTFAASIEALMLYGTLIALGLVGVWIIAALFVGRSFNKLTKENRIIE
ncbi:MAG: Npt1/Npt2 family nucleotide transporter [Candidatus Babeliales bacterium]